MGILPGVSPLGRGGLALDRQLRLEWALLPSPAQLGEEWTADDPHYPSLLDWFGEQGWELVTVLTGQRGWIDFIFKRPRAEDTDGSDDAD